jgi:hypothetical protein
MRFWIRLGAGLSVAALLAGATAMASSRVNPRDSEGQKARRVNATVTPAQGPPGTRFLVSFKARNELRGKVFYDVEATGPEPAQFGDCDNDSAIFRHAHRGDRVRVRMPRRGVDPHWCPGRYEGTVFLEDWRHPPGKERDKAVGEFSFDVTEASGG